jgi:hypothetical protein
MRVTPNVIPKVHAAIFMWDLRRLELTIPTSGYWKYS